MRRIHRSSGFTLIEVLVALAVVGVAVTVFFSLFSSSIRFAETSRNESIAASLAEEQLVAVCQNPSSFNWGLKAAAPGQLVTVNASAAGSTAQFTAPALAAISESEKNLYEQFSYKIFAKVPSAEAAYVEVIVAVEWTEAGRNRVFTLTSTVARSLVTAMRAMPAVREEA